jgi:hypothetical protein
MSRHTPSSHPAKSSWHRASIFSLGTRVQVSAPQIGLSHSKRLATARGVRSFSTRSWITTLSTLKPSCSLALAGTILLSGHRCAMASFGSPEGHNRSEGTLERACCVDPSRSSSRQSMDALLRFRLVSRVSRDSSLPSCRAVASHSSRQAMTTACCAEPCRTPPGASTSRARSTRPFARASASRGWAWFRRRACAGSPRAAGAPTAG